MVGVRAEMVGLEDALAEGFEIFRRAELAGIEEATTGLKEDLRAQTRAAGLGSRLPTTWQSRFYPNPGDIRGPAGFVWSQAPRIMSLFAYGGTIRPHGGSNYLWIPTDAVPLSTSGPRGSTRRGGKRKMTPTEVEYHFNQDLFVRRGKNGHFLAFLNLVTAKSRKRPGFRQPTRRRAAAGRKASAVLMFVLVRSVTFRKRIDLEGAAQRWGARLPDLIEKNWRE
jgi:hypothetical protein